MPRRSSNRPSSLGVVHEYGSVDYILYLSKEEIYEEIERRRLWNYVEDAVRTTSVMSKVSKEDLEKIADIISKYTTKEKPNLDFSHRSM